MITEERFTADMGEIKLPSNAVLCKKGMKTKKIYMNAKESFNYVSNSDFGDYLLAENNIDVIHIIVSTGTRGVKVLYYYSNYTPSDYPRSIKHENGYASYILTCDETIEIQKDTDYCFYCIPEETKLPIELQPMPKIDKLIDSSSFEQVSSKLQEINNLLKVSSDNLKTIMDANNISYLPTDGFIELVQKLHNK